MSLLQRLNPSLVPTNFRERLRASAGALTGIALTGLVSTLALGTDVNLPLLIAPMGASAVLLFAAPTSPLAQPWSIVGGNLVAAFVGVTCGKFIGEPLVAASLAVSIAIGIMLMLNCLHPPSGAVALTAVLGGASLHDLGYWFVLSPVGVNTALILLVALLFNNATGRSYPHLAPAAVTPAHGTTDPPTSRRIGASSSDIKAVMEEYGEIIDISPEELDDLLHKAQIRAFSRQSNDVTCADVMSRDVLTVTGEARLKSAWRTLITHRIKALPVVSLNGELEGIVTQDDFVRHSVLADDGTLRLGFGRRMLASVNGRAVPKQVSDIMTRRVQSALPNTPIGALVSPMADQGLHHMPVVDEGNRVVGIITQTDLLAALFQVRAEPLAESA